MKALIAAPFLLLIAACGAKEERKPETPAAPEAQGLLLAADPGQAMSVMEAKAAAPKEGVVVAGRVRDIIKGVTQFQIIDAALEYCGSGKDQMDDCKTPWDYCCHEKSEIAAQSVFVEALGADGKPVATPSLPGLRLLDIVVIKGDLLKDAQGNVTLKATGWFRRARPDLSADLNWP